MLMAENMMMIVPHAWRCSGLLLNMKAPARTITPDTKPKREMPAIIPRKPKPPIMPQHPPEKDGTKVPDHVMPTAPPRTIKIPAVSDRPNAGPRFLLSAMGGGFCALAIIDFPLQLMPPSPRVSGRICVDCCQTSTCRWRNRSGRHVLRAPTSTYFSFHRPSFRTRGLLPLIITITTQW